MPFTREECLMRLNAVLAQHKIIFAAGAGIGLSAKCSQEAGADLIVTYIGARHRMAGRPSATSELAVGDANGVSLALAAEVLPVAQDTPVVVGVFAHDRFRLMEVLLKQLREAGFSGVQNGPMLTPSAMFTKSGYTFEAETRMIATARRMGFLTVPSVQDIDQAREMAPYSDVIVAQVGGPTGLSSVALEKIAAQVQSIHDAAKKANPHVLVICHGGPIAEPEDLGFILKTTQGIVGYQSGSSVERLPVERAIRQAIRSFKDLRLIDRADAS